ncbi:hypothetical protein HSBGL_0317 [Halapricum desulfuricans]|uniref:Uncharacterized protein n=2 Tax=Halapricum desulfuricans TaxID=2841257 RepID=A0A897NEA5_9EURY|nr:hypothetical protein HSBGL_0317 [Halapricum desulfuricans]
MQVALDRSTMQATRRAVLAGLAGTVAASGCLRRDPDRPSRTTVTEQTTHDSEETNGSDQRTPLFPTVVDREPDGEDRTEQAGRQSSSQ